MSGETRTSSYNDNVKFIATLSSVSTMHCVAELLLLHTVKLGGGRKASELWELSLIAAIKDSIR